MKKKILFKIKELIKNRYNFVYGNYYDEDADGIEYLVDEKFDAIRTRKTLIDFAEWLLREK